jgi:hypothetical protein
MFETEVLYSNVAISSFSISIMHERHMYDKYDFF